MGDGRRDANADGRQFPIWTPIYTAVIIGFLFWSSYRQIARIFKWITLVLLAYVATAFFAGVDWHQALLATLVRI